MRALAFAFAAFCAAPALADEPAISKSLLVSDQGLGSSVAVTLMSASLDGHLKVFSAGVGAGVSWKSLADGGRYPYEIGFYVSPQVEQGGSAQAVSTIAVVVHATLLKSFGLGIGAALWKSGVGLQRTSKENVFLTLGMSPTNSR